MPYGSRQHQSWRRRHPKPDPVPAGTGFNPRTPKEDPWGSPGYFDDPNYYAGNPISSPKEDPVTVGDYFDPNQKPVDAPGYPGGSGDPGDGDNWWETIDWGGIFGDTFSDFGQQGTEFDERFDSTRGLITDALAQGLPPELRQALMGAIGQSFDQQQRGLTEQFAGQRGGALSAATAQLGGQEGLAIAQGEANLAGLELDREQTLLGQLAGVDQAQSQAELGLLGEKADFATDFAKIGVDLQALSQNASQFAQNLELNWAQLDQNQKQFAALLLLDQAKFEESIKQFNVSEQNKLTIMREQIEAGEYGWGDFAGDILGAGATVLSAASFVTSDFRVKENIKEVGISEEGIPIVEFNYIGKPKRWRGVIAQDVEKIMPNAVTTHQGVKYVDYSQLTVKMVECHG